MKVVLTEAAYADLLYIGRTIREDNPTRADSFVSELYDRCQRPGAMPAPFRCCPIGKSAAFAVARMATI